MAYRTMKTTSQMGNDVTSQIGNTIGVCLMSRLLWENYSTPFTRERCRRDWYKQSHKMPPDGGGVCALLSLGLAAPWRIKALCKPEKQDRYERGDHNPLPYVDPRLAPGQWPNKKTDRSPH
jgi:hypothetical protein